MPRLLFEKTGNAIWISHLDLMRLFQRAFKRAGLPLTHTHGFNPRPSVSIALPLSVGVESNCELLDFDLDGQTVTMEDMVTRLNQSLVAGVKVRQAYEGGRKIKDIALLNCVVSLEYDRGVPAEALAAITELFTRDSVVVPKKTKSGIQDQNIIPMIRRIDSMQTDDHTIELNCMIHCQNPSLNPAQLVSAIQIYLPQFTPDFAKSRRLEVYDLQENIFR